MEKTQDIAKLAELQLLWKDEARAWYEKLTELTESSVEPETEECERVTRSLEAIAEQKVPDALERYDSALYYHLLGLQMDARLLRQTLQDRASFYRQQASYR